MARGAFRGGAWGDDRFIKAKNLLWQVPSSTGYYAGRLSKGLEFSRDPAKRVHLGGRPEPGVFWPPAGD